MGTFYRYFFSDLLRRGVSQSLRLDGAFHCQNFKKKECEVKTKLVLILSLTFCLAISMAKADVMLNGDEITKISLSKESLVRFHARDGYIAQVYSDTSCYQEKFSDGDWFLKVKPGCTSEKFNVFVKIQNKQSTHTHLLTLYPKEGGYQNIILVSNGNGSTASKWETDTPYEQVISKIMKGLWSHQLPPGYRLVQSKDEKRQSLGQMAYLYETSRIVGAHLSGISYQLKNRRNHTIHLHERFFTHPGVRAVSMLRSSVPAHGSTIVFVVEENAHV